VECEAWDIGGGAWVSGGVVDGICEAAGRRTTARASTICCVADAHGGTGGLARPVHNVGKTRAATGGDDGE
jgi:hypothetical protein